MDPLFNASHLKLKRAHKFIVEIEESEAAYKASAPASGTPDYARGRVELNLKPVDQEVGAAIGDAIHNMRAALDLMAAELARLGGKSDKNVYFPFSRSESELDEAIEDKKFNRAGKLAVELLKQFQPYKGGNSALRGIHDLDVLDKHRTITVVGRSVEVEVSGSYHLDHRLYDSLSVSTKNAFLLFDDGPFREKKVVETLKHLVEVVESVIEAFAALQKP